MTMSTRVHSSATTGFADGATYDTFRPTYPASAVTALLSGMKLSGSNNATILEIAAGTGKFTESLARQKEGFRVVAVEPVAGMRETLEKKGLTGVEVRNGVATGIPLGDGEADAVIAAQSFHWFANKSALTEFARVLKPGGYLGVIWNVEDYNKPASWPAQTPWENQLNKMIFSLPPDGQDRFRHLAWKNAFTPAENTGPSGTPLFATPIEQGSSEVWTSLLTPEELLERIGTLSQMVALKGEAREKWEEEFWKVLEGVEKDGEGKVAVHGKTFFVWTRKL